MSRRKDHYCEHRFAVHAGARPPWIGRRCWLFLLAALVFWQGCAGQGRPRPPAQPEDGLYDSEAQLQPVSPVLRQAMAAIRRITATAHYKTYYFSRDTALTMMQWKMYDYRRLATHVVSTNRSKAGTAVVLARDKGVVYLLTALHVVDYPDTQFTFYPNPQGRPGPYLQSVSFKEYQRNLIAGLPGTEPFRIRSRDERHDLVVLEAPMDPAEENPPPVFPFPMGRAAELDWGTRVWVLGFPRGFGMVTSGLVSSPNRDAEHNFLVDALFNRGSSGSVVLAFRDGVQHPEWVGVITAVPAKELPVLAPDQLRAGEGVEGLPYRGVMSIRSLTLIDYGIAFGVSAEVVEKFLVRSGVPGLIPEPSDGKREPEPVESSGPSVEQ